MSPSLPSQVWSVTFLGKFVLDGEHYRFRNWSGSQVSYLEEFMTPILAAFHIEHHMRTVIVCVRISRLSWTLDEIKDTEHCVCRHGRGQAEDKV